MASEIVASVPAAAEVLDRANEVLDFDLKDLCLNGPAERLAATDVCQPAILATSAAVVQLAVPVIAALGGWALLGEELTPRLVGAGSLTLGGVALAVLARGKKE